MFGCVEYCCIAGCRLKPLVFDSIDTDDDRRIDIEEFRAGFPLLGLKMNADEVFAAIDTNNGGIILFIEFCAWFADNMNVEELLADELESLEMD